jgi:hypothetical protein
MMSFKQFQQQKTKAIKRSPKPSRFLAIVERTLKRPFQPKKKTSNPKL